MADDRHARRFADLDHRGLEREVHLERGRVPALGIVGERALDDGAHRRGDRGGKGIGRRRARELVQRGDLVGAVERRLAAEDLVEDRAERPHIRSVIERLAHRLLRGHVTDLALELTCARVLRDAITRLRDAEVDEDGVARVCDEDVLGGDVAVDDAEVGAIAISERVGGMETGGGVCADAQGDARGDRRLLRLGRAEDLRERVAVDPLHDDEGVLAFFSDVEDARDVGVLDLRGDARLVDEHFLKSRILRILRQDHLDDHEALESLSTAEAGEPDRRHASICQRAKELVAVESIAGREAGRIHPLRESIPCSIPGARRSA